MQAIIELPLEAPLELRMVQITRVQIEVIGVHRYTRIPELDDQFDAITFAASIEREQRVLIETELSEYAIQARLITFNHRCIVKRIGGNSLKAFGFGLHITRSAALRSDPASLP